MEYMAQWYREYRSAFLLLQSVFGILVVSYSLRPRKAFPLRLVLSTALGCLILILIGKHIYVPGYSALAILSHAAVPLLVFLLLVGVTWCSYDETIWTVLFTASTGYIAQDIGGSVKTLLRQIPLIDLSPGSSGASLPWIF